VVIIGWSERQPEPEIPLGILNNEAFSMQERRIVVATRVEPEHKIVNPEKIGIASPGWIVSKIAVGEVIAELGETLKM
jgi:hypothetical protein